MSELENYVKRIEHVARKKARYKAQAYFFIVEALEFTVTKCDEKRHVTGQELAWGIKDCALEQFGPLSKTVLNFWGISETYDFGVIVYDLIGAKLMKKTSEDSIDDFKQVYSFDEVFHASAYDYLDQLGES